MTKALFIKGILHSDIQYALLFLLDDWNPPAKPL